MIFALSFIHILIIENSFHTHAASMEKIDEKAYLRAYMLILRMLDSKSRTQLVVMIEIWFFHILLGQRLNL